MISGEGCALEIIKDIAAVIGCLLSLISLITICTKKGRAIVRNFVLKNTEDIQKENQRQADDIEEIKDLISELSVRFDEFGERFDAVEENARQQCRSTIKHIYYKYQASKRIPLYERKTADKTYDIYHNQLHGNSYIALLYEQIAQWEIEKITGADLIEESEE